MEHVVLIKGEVEHSLTIDPSVWIFDERKVDLNTYFTEEKSEQIDELSEYTKKMSEHWDRELLEGSEPPDPNRNDNKIVYNKQQLITGSFAMVFEPFLLNARPKPSAKSVTIQTKDASSLSISLDEAKQLVLAFSKDGKPLREDGPIHVYFGDGSNQNSPIKHVIAFIIE